MDDIKPKFQCTNCHRGVLSRSAERCLFCGAMLPVSVRLSPEELARRATDDKAVRERERRDWVQPQPQPGKLDGVGDILDLFGDF